MIIYTYAKVNKIKLGAQTGMFTFRFTWNQKW